METNREMTLLQDACAYHAAYTYLLAWEEQGMEDRAGFTNAVLSTGRSSLFYLYQSCTHPNTRSENLAKLMEDMVCHTMSFPDIRNLLVDAHDRYPLMDEMADYLNQTLAEACMDGRPEFLLAAKIMAPEHVWRPALEPVPQEVQPERELPPNLEEIREDGRLGIGPGWWPILDRVLEEIAETEPKADEINPSSVEIKEKYGGLRIYIAHRFQDSGHITKLLQEAEEVSLCTCEECGRPGAERDVNGWITTLCSECFAKNRVK